MKRSILIFVLASLLFLGGDASWTGREVAVPAYNSHNLIRLHVIANSDTTADQELKRHVRDAVLASIGRSLAAAGDIGAARQLVSHNLAAITAAAEAQIRREGQNYTVRTEFGDFAFPTRAYGDITLPAGNYEAVRLVIGAGKGENWWCVLFPPLCLVDAAGKADDDALTSRPVMAGEEGQAKIRVGWKILEIFQSSRHRLAGLWP
ncbi:Sporulation stage II, protein R [Moorella glycerini]|uniref:Stage II sporulation protein R n=1 Tax=Neomoorella stamsii TaxID=1266720 RepID=A0A9X7J1Z4_9FIRM|nr:MULTISPECIES: stage II sporulation protein R [Moorella]PRR72200.1 Stage II sporulation protein R [Moorella stamsii]CEP69501.1 Sporulation stage II, protein R [Moorella glycerini]